MKIPEPEYSTHSLIDKFYENQPHKFRQHLGVSQIGRPCDREIWFSFRWAFRPNFPGRVLRLFRRGQNEEEVIANDLRAIGVTVTETGDEQRVIDFGCHVGGSVDGIITGGVPEAPKKQHVLECKTHSKKSFDALEKEGVEKSKPEHFAQMQLYMMGTGIDRALYASVCKDDDRYYFERVRYSPEAAEKYLSRGKRLALAETIPPPLSTDPSWYQCKMCNAWDLCHGSKQTKEVNCRTCAHSTPLDTGKWHCSRWDAEIPVHAQKEGCRSHVIHPDLIPWRLDQERSEEFTAAYEIEGKIVMNGENGIDSRELLDKEVQAVKKVFDGEVVDFDALRKAK